MKFNLEELKSRLIPLYLDLRKDSMADENLSPFLMQWGEKFPSERNKGIIFYGRATNGWHGNWNYEVFFDNHNDKRGWNRDDQMIWAERLMEKPDGNYNIRQSQFWNIIKGVSTRFNGIEWYKYVAWSNICKVAPKDEGNPSDNLFEDTLKDNKRIFQTEIDFWSPKYVVLFTDGLRRDNKTIIDWTSPFISSFSNDEHPSPIYETSWDDDNPNIKILVYKFGNRYFLLTLHPQGRKVDLHKEAIIDIIEKAEHGEI